MSLNKLIDLAILAKEMEQDTGLIGIDVYDGKLQFTKNDFERLIKRYPSLKLTVEERKDREYPYKVVTEKLGVRMFTIVESIEEVEALQAFSETLSAKQ